MFFKKINVKKTFLLFCTIFVFVLGLGLSGSYSPLVFAGEQPGDVKNEPPVEMPPVETPPAEMPPEEDTPVEMPPVEEPPVEMPPVENPPDDLPPIDVPPVELPPGEE